MSVGYGSTGAGATGSTSLSVAYPASIAAGDLLVLGVVSKYPTNGPTTPSGWTLAAQAQGGSGSAGLNAGDVYVTAYTREADGTEAGSLAVTLTGCNSAAGAISRYTKTAGYAWSVAATSGTDTSAGTGWSVTGAADPGIAAGDMVVAVTGANGDAASASGQSVTTTGVTYGGTTERTDTRGTIGDKCIFNVCTADATSGASSAAPAFAATFAASGANYPCGATVLVRLREDPPAGTDPLGRGGFFGL